MSVRTPVMSRKLAVAGPRLVWSALLLAVPARVIRAAGGTADPRSVGVARVLGARHALQGTVELLAWPRAHRAGALVDLLHAGTAAGLAALDPARRRVALVDTVGATTFAVVGTLAARPGR